MSFRAAGVLACMMLLVMGCSLERGSEPGPEAGLEPVSTSMSEELRGRLVYASACASCHGTQAQGGRTVSLTGTFFESEWGGSKVSVLARYIAREMPPKRTHMMITVEEAEAVARLLNALNGNLLAP